LRYKEEKTSFKLRVNTIYQFTNYKIQFKVVSFQFTVKRHNVNKNNSDGLPVKFKKYLMYQSKQYIV